jgi:ubiquinone/menaquinone biosynthesis C-methylase UbiE
MSLRLRLPAPGTLTQNDEVDPLRFYYVPVVGRIFRARIDLGLKLLEGRFRRVLEIGYGSGLLLPTLGRICEELYGADVVRERPALRERLARLGTRPRELVQADIQSLPFPERYFEGVVAFSILEHLRSDELGRAVREVARVLEPGGRFLVGCPAVHKVMNAAFAAIGFRGIENHHFSSILDVLAASEEHFEVIRTAALPRALAWAMPIGWAPYTAVLLRRR